LFGTKDRPMSQNSTEYCCVVYVSSFSAAPAINFSQLPPALKDALTPILFTVGGTCAQITNGAKLGFIDFFSCGLLRTVQVKETCCAIPTTPTTPTTGNLMMGMAPKGKCHVVCFSLHDCGCNDLLIRRNVSLNGPYNEINRNRNDDDDVGAKEL
jgi:hypothetical protein